MSNLSISNDPPRRWYERASRIFWVAFAVRVIVMLIGHTYHVRVRDDHWEFGYEAGRIARSLVLGHGYADPFNGHSGPTAWLPPIFPLIMAAAFKLFGVYTEGSVIAVMVVDCLFSALIAPAVFEIGWRCFDAQGFGRRGSTKATPVALWAGWLWALYPAAIQYAIHWLWEMSLSACLFTWAIVVALRLRRVGEKNRDKGEGIRDKGQWGLWVGFGLMWGAVAMSNATLLSCAPVAAIWAVWPRFFGGRQGLSKAVAGAVLSGVMALLVLVPWVVRNERVFHAFLPTRSNFGIEFWNATVWYHDAYPWGSAVPLSPDHPEFKQFIAMGELPYAKMRGEEAKANLKANPGLYAKFTALRFQYFWFIWRHPSDAKPVAETLRLWNYGFLSLSGLLGLFVALKRRVPGAWLFAFVFALMPLPYYFVTVQARFRHPIEPLICVLAVFLFRGAESKSKDFQEQKL